MSPGPNHLRLVALSTLSLALLLVGGPAAARTESTLTCGRISELSRTYLHRHIQFHFINDELRDRIVDTYVKRLDPSKSFFLQSEVKSLKAKLRGVIQDVREGDCAPLMAIQQDLLERYERTEAFAKEVLGDESYELDTDAFLIIDPDKRGNPRDDEARKELLTKLIHFQISNYLSSDMEMAEAKQKLIHRYELMTKRAKELTEEDIYASYLDTFASALDPHSNYLSRDVLEDFQISMGLSLEGIGVALSSKDGYSIVEKVIPGGAADHLDVLEPQDKIIAVAQDGEEPVDIIDMNLRDVVRLIRGKRGTKVHLTILRQSDSAKRFRVTIERDKINLEEQAAKLRFEQVPVEGGTAKLAILELPSFYGGRNPGERQSSRDVRNLLEQVKREKAAGLLLDLSRNGGGLLENSVDIAGYFIKQGGIVAVKDTYSKVQVLDDEDADIAYSGPMVVLTSRVSASASEIVAGALKDYGRAVIVGDDHTFGKGTVQSMVPLPEGLGALKVTTALFFRPGGRSTQHSGVGADIIVPSVFGTDEFGEMHQDYSLPSQSIDPFVGPDLPAENSSDLRMPWPPITHELLAELKRRSQQRTEADEKLVEVRERIAKAEERNGVVHLAELIKEKAEQSAKESKEQAAVPGAEGVHPGAATEPEEEDPSPQQREALRILADLVSLGSPAIAFQEQPEPQHVIH